MSHIYRRRRDMSMQENYVVTLDVCYFLCFKFLKILIGGWVLILQRISPGEAPKPFLPFVCLSGEWEERAARQMKMSCPDGGIGRKRGLG
ncbi:hypothetical protein CC78DRAFT_529583 [Lojkania enalia]|uniref:Uncharacterized protein n=1 Tax=Lojkania enalia TaxID=147567 RepID=A0A9P4KIH2_9PLEO|nr:hypothetical protein CC78DRAFT_529583 [Didymosphaeria enalia]